MSYISELYVQWEKGEGLNDLNETELSNQLDEYIKNELYEIILQMEKNPQEAFSRLTQMTNFISALSKKLPHILKKINNAISTHSKYIQSIGKNLGASSVSISFSLTGITVSLTFSV